jgi:hypothetical protein
MGSLHHKQSGTKNGKQANCIFYTITGGFSSANFIPYNPAFVSFHTVHTERRRNATYDTHRYHGFHSLVPSQQSLDGRGTWRGEPHISYTETIVSANQPVIPTGGTILSSDQSFISTDQPIVPTSGTVLSSDPFFISANRAIVPYHRTDAGVLLSASRA